MAASVQQLTGLVVEDFTGAAVARTECRDVRLTGAVALNDLVNQRLLERRVVDALFMPPFTDDRGLAVGAAALAAYERGAPVRSVSGGIARGLPLRRIDVPFDEGLIGKVSAS